jgi:hypothetical protein
MAEIVRHVLPRHPLQDQAEELRAAPLIAEVFTGRAARTHLGEDLAQVGRVGGERVVRPGPMSNRRLPPPRLLNPKDMSSRWRSVMPEPRRPGISGSSASAATFTEPIRPSAIAAPTSSATIYFAAEKESCGDSRDPPLK